MKVPPPNRTHATPIFLCVCRRFWGCFLFHHSFSFAMQDLVLDEKIRDWAVIPVALVMLLIGVWRHYLSLYLDSKQAASLHDVCEGFDFFFFLSLLFSLFTHYYLRQAITRARRLRQNADILPVASFHRKRAYFNDKVPSLPLITFHLFIFSSFHLFMKKKKKSSPKRGMKSFPSDNLYFYFLFKRDQDYLFERLTSRRTLLVLLTLCVLFSFLFFFFLSILHSILSSPFFHFSSFLSLSLSFFSFYFFFSLPFYPFFSLISLPLSLTSPPPQQKTPHSSLKPEWIPLP